MERASPLTVAALLLVLGAAAPSVGQAPPPREPPLSPLLVDSLAPLLAMWIAAERDAAKEQGVEPIPAAVRAVLQGHVPDDVLDRVRWRQGGTQLSLPQNAFRFGHVPAMTLQDVIVFQDRGAALEDPKLWAHELKHVMQFAEWGLDEFARRYVRDYQAVEDEAWEFRWQFMKKAGLLPPVPGAGE
jgi:hypothetical protein